MFVPKRTDLLSSVAVEVWPETTALASATKWLSLEKNGELGSCQRLFGRTVEHTQLVDKAIQGRTEIMSNFTDADA